MGRRIDKVDLFLTGTLQSNFQMQPYGNGYEIGFLSSKKGLIAEGLEEHFNCQIFGVTEQDRSNINLIVDNFTSNLSK
jgi:hypothetical protein